MDAFEARLQFLQVIKNLHKTLNASKDNSPLSGGSQQQNDPVSFYLRHYEHHYEDFQQCMLDSAAKMDSLDRLNVLIYWSRLISMLWPRCMKDVDGELNSAGKVVHGHLLGQLDEMVSLVLPEDDWKALTNLNVCVDIVIYLNRLCEVLDSPSEEKLLQGPIKQLLTPQTVSEVGTENHRQFLELPWLQTVKKDQNDYKKALTNCYHLLVDRKNHAAALQELYRIEGICSVSQAANCSTVLHRMENDRERHKKSKEHLWFTERNFILDGQEFDSMWNSCRGMTRNDYSELRELNKIAHNSYMYN
ncbi:LAME_0G13498g1_1 [Lachancea meyersii CBS 8951]|uniref:LAME_0G13498g1_1 n=1 Tax=Lachancea meyersii CBS 8951 TaxID=1266667 RepID=A0A1G4KA44_9SACH|nr:LAME_0G13498g1_1 [Lachancea meyersii CBS 8951]